MALTIRSFLHSPLQWGQELISKNFGAPDQDDPDQFAEIARQSSDTHIPVVYGQRKIPGIISAPPMVDGDDNEYQHLVVTLCEGEIESLDNIWVDGVDLFGDLSYYTTEGQANIKESRAKILPNLQLRFAAGVNTAANIISDASNGFPSGLTSDVDDISESVDYQAANEDGGDSDVTGSPVVVGNTSTVTRTIITYTETQDATPEARATLWVGSYPYIKTTRVITTVTTTYDDVNMELAVGDLHSDWTTTPADGDRYGYGIAYVYLRFKYDPDVFRGTPKLAFSVSGKKVYNVTSGSTVYSANPANCTYDYLTSTVYGKAVAAARIDLASFQAAESHYDTSLGGFDMKVCSRAGLCSTVRVGADKRATTNGVVNTEKKIMDNIKAIVGSCDSMLHQIGGLFTLTPDKAETSSQSFTEDASGTPILSDIALTGKGKRDRYNQVTINFTNPDKGWTKDTYTVYSAAHLSEDGGIVNSKSLTLPFVTSEHEARRIATKIMALSRENFSISFMTTLAGLERTPGDVIDLTHDTPGWSGKLFKVKKVDLNGDASVTISAIEYDASDYGEVAAGDLEYPQQTSLPSSSSIALPSNVGIFSGPDYNSRTPDGELIRNIKLTWDASADPYFFQTECEYSVKDSGVWVDGFVASKSSTDGTITGLSRGVAYDIRLRHVNSIGTVSAWFNITNYTATDDQSIDYAAPNVTGLSLLGQTASTEFTGPDAHFEWRNVSGVSVDWSAMDNGPGGMDAQGKDPAFDTYVVQVWADGEMVHEEDISVNKFSYRLQDNFEDYLQANEVAGAWREFTTKVYTRTIQGVLSAIPASLTVSNPAPALPTGVSVTAGFNQVKLSFIRPTDRDYAGVKVWVSTTQGFTVSESTLKFDDFSSEIVIPNLASGTKYYLRFGVYDEFSSDDYTLSSEYAFTTDTGIASSEVSGLGAWATRIDPVDSTFLTTYTESGSIVTALLASDSVTTDKLAALAVTANELASSSVTATKIANLAVGTAAIANLAVTNAKIGDVAAGKITADTINVKLTLGGVYVAAEGIAAAINGDGAGLAASDYRTELGPVTDDDVTYGSGTTYVLRMRNGYEDGHPSYLSPFWIDGDGNAEYAGDLSAAGGTFTGTLSGADGTFSGTITASSFTTAASGKRIEINPSSDNEIHFYGDRGDTTVEELATIGLTSSGSDFIIAKFGSLNSTRIAISAQGIKASAATITSYAGGSSGRAVYGDAPSGYGGHFDGGLGPVLLVADASASAPTHIATKGTLWVTSAGVLYINTSSSTTWAKVGAQ